MIIRRDLLSRMAELFNEGNFVKGIDRIPLELAPRRKGKQDRCCIYKERAIAKYKLIPLLGFDLNEYEDELTPLSEYAKRAIDREEPPTNKILTVVDEACTSCVKNNYIVTNLCKGCVAHPCMMNCPKDAISWNANGQAQINPKSCVNCGICMGVCPYHSIIYMPVPCENSCPVGAISKDEYGIEHINEDKCIHCGKCLLACPFGSIMENSQIVDIMKHLRGNTDMIAIVAPAILGQFGTDIKGVLGAIKELGFDQVIEVAKGANQTTTHEAEELLERIEQGDSFMTTSCCPAYMKAVDSHIPEMAKYVSETKSPMFYTAQECKQQSPNAKVVFIGPCIAKRREGMDDPNVDYVMTFEELSALFTGWKIDITTSKDLSLDQDIINHGRGYATSGGVTQSVLKYKPDAPIKSVLVNGLDKKKINMLKAFAKTGKASGNFIEVMACEGGCIAGPSSYNDPKSGAKLLSKNLQDLEE